MNWLKFFVSFTFTVILILFLSIPLGKAPFALGKFLDPFHGFWQNAEPTKAEQPANLFFSDVSDEIEVVYDDRKVPHIFASNDKDLAFAQGYVTAVDRLWEMEFITHVAAGRLAELVGGVPKALASDRKFRRLGMRQAAETSIKSVMANAKTKELIEAYTAGVNAYIRQLAHKDLPIEYKILNYGPEQWSPLKTALLQKYMAYDLTFRPKEISNTYAADIWGSTMFEQMYSKDYFEEAPVIPLNTLWNFGEVIPPTTPSSYKPDSLLVLNGSTPQALYPEPNIGSNNWAIDSSKSTTGYPILASDPHLRLGLPSIWYEIQLTSPDLHVYGVSLPGAPGVIIGFNDSISWGVTNAARDVVDFYEIEFRNGIKNEYNFKGSWEKIDTVIEKIIVRGGDPIYDTIYYTKLGPIFYDENYGNKGLKKPLAVRWLAHDPSNEALAFYKLNKAKNYTEFLEALSHYQVPAQNFAFASSSGDIAIWQQGKFVNRWKDQGRFILKASDSTHHWNSFIPQTHNPHVLNPPRGFVASANQKPTDDTYPYHYNGFYETFRNRRLTDKLTSMQNISVKDMMRIQQDNYSELASDVLPSLLSYIDSVRLSNRELKVYEKMKEWNYLYDANEIAPTMFNTWWKILYYSIWEDEFSRENAPLRRPTYAITAQVIRDTTSFMFIDDVKTAIRERRKDIVNTSFYKMVDSLYKYNEAIEEWKWGTYKGTRVLHLAEVLKPFNEEEINIGGNRHILNATSERHGPSWRMIVSLGPKVEAYGIYPGGQSGNPGSRHYNEFLPKWVEGEYDRLWFMKQASETGEKPREVLYRQTISPIK